MAIMDRRKTTLEQRVVEILTALSCAGILWIGSSIIDIKTQIAGLTEKYALRVELQDVKAEVQRIKDEQQRIMLKERR